MCKKAITTAAVGLALLGLVGTSMAADIQINLYGASAQYLYWNSAAATYLTGKGCAVTGPVQTTDSKNGYTIGTGCTDANNYAIRYSSKASYDGILALKGDDSQAGAADKCLDTDFVCDMTGTSTTNQVGSGQHGFYRLMKANSTAGDNTRCCAKVNVAASDVAGSAFTQNSHGCLLGMATVGQPGCTGSNWADRAFNGIDTTGLTDDQPLIVPFGFFANNCITKTKCLAPDPTEPDYWNVTGNPDPNKDKAISSWGNQCYDPSNTGHSTDCIGYYKCVLNDDNTRTCAGGVRKGLACDSISGTNGCPDVDVSATICERIPIDNITRLMATLIYSGQATKWQDFGKWWDGDCDMASTSDQIYACMRHAGSGTQATFDIMMRGLGYGKDWLHTQTTASGRQIWFNDGSGDMMNCIAGKTWNSDGTTTARRNIGAIGFADCDQIYGASASGTARIAYENVHALKYDGVECKRPKIRNGEYEFYSPNHDFFVTADPNAAVFQAFIDYSKLPANLPPSKTGYWATKAEMVFLKSGDTAWPARVAPTQPQVP